MTPVERRRAIERVRREAGPLIAQICQERRIAPRDFAATREVHRPEVVAARWEALRVLCASPHARRSAVAAALGFSEPTAQRVMRTIDPAVPVDPTLPFRRRRKRK